MTERLFLSELTGEWLVTDSASPPTDDLGNPMLRIASRKPSQTLSAGAWAEKILGGVTVDGHPFERLGVFYAPIREARAPVEKVRRELAEEADRDYWYQRADEEWP